MVNRPGVAGFGRKVFADEEAIETNRKVTLDIGQSRRKVFADEEAIET